MTRPRSIRRFLLSGILALVSASLAISALIGYLEANHEMEELFDARLAQSSRITNQLLSRYLAPRRPGPRLQQRHQGQPRVAHLHPLQPGRAHLAHRGGAG